MSTMATLTVEQYAALMEAWRTTGVSEEAQIEAMAQAVADCAVRVALPDPALPIIVLAGAGRKGAIGMAAVRLLAEREVAVRLVLGTAPSALTSIAAAQYQILQECGIPAWGLSMSQAEIDAQEPIEWLSVGLVVDALLESDIQSDPDGEVADLIRMVNVTRRPVLSLEVASGVSTDEGYILSPCIMATHTIAIGLPLRSVVEAAPVSGEVWLAEASIPVAVWEAVALSPYSFEGESLVNLGAARRLR